MCENRLKFYPKILVDDPTPSVGYTLPKIIKNGNSINYLTPLLNLLGETSLFIKILKLKIPQISIVITLNKKQNNYRWRNLRFIDKLFQMLTIEFQYQESAC
jgi:hypothetical protein